MSAMHDVTIEVRDGFTRLKFHCRADTSTNPHCHMVCPESECEEGCYDSGHTRESQGECGVVQWLENDDAEHRIIEDADNRVTIPIRIEWHSEGVDWAFAGGAS